MRPELFGPLPLLIGIAVVAAALAWPARAPPPPACACPVLTPAEFDALEASGYAGLLPNSTLIVDGRVTSLYPSPLVSAPYRYVQLEGSSARFNVTKYDAATGPVGEWVRITAAHEGRNESGGPDAGHRWSYFGKSAAPGGGAVSLAGLAFGVALAGWGAATWGEGKRTRARAADLKARVDRARSASAGDPAASKAEGLRKEIAGAAAMVRRGQYDSAQTALGDIEAQLSRAGRLGEALASAKALLDKEVSGGFAGAPVRSTLDEAEKLRSEGSIPEAEPLVAKAMATLSNLGPLRETIAAAAQSLEASGEAGIEDPEAEAWLAKARELLGVGKIDAALAEAEKAHHRAREISPGAKEARSEIDRLKDFLQLRPEFDRSREVRDRVRDADELYRLGMFDRALAEARVGMWLADPNALSVQEFEAIAKRRFASDGYTVDPPRAKHPPLGFLAVKAGATTVVVSAAWRDFPGERVMFALKDFMAEGGAERAIVYSSAFTNTSTDARIEVVDAAALVKLLLDAALTMTA